MNAPRTADVIQTPACISDLEDRIQSNVTFWSAGLHWHVEANCTAAHGVGCSLPGAVHNFLVNMGLEAR